MSIGTYPPQIGAVPIAIEQGGTNAITAAQARTNLGHGTMSTQNADAVAITGGTVRVDTGYIQGNPVGSDAFTVYPGSATVNSLGVGVPGHALPEGTLQTLAECGFGGAVMLGIRVKVTYNKDIHHGILIEPVGASDASGGNALIFRNLALATVGSIFTSATATAYNTASDVRLKHAVEKLVGSLDLIRVLNPISFLWKVNDERGEGFRADELQQVLPYAVTGEPDALNEDGTIAPQQVDYSKLVPRLVGAIQELLVRVEALEARRV